MTCNFKVGQKVVCINDDVDFYPMPTGQPEMHGLTKGEIYTITGIGPHRAIKDRICCTVAEITHPMRLNPASGYGVERFRPLQEKKDEYKSKWVIKLIEKLKQGDLEKVC